jgi:hypothetical protein
MRSLLFACLVALGAGCAHSSSHAAGAGDAAAVGPTGQYSYQSSEGAYTVSLTPTGLSGPNYQLSRTPDAIRGQVGGRTVDLSWTQDGVTGSYGGQPVRLTLQPTGDGTRVSGLWGGAIGNLVLGPKSLEGKIGRCSYSMGRMGQQLTGQSTCGAAPSNTTVSLPEGIAQPLDGQSAAVLALLLGQ